MYANLAWILKRAYLKLGLIALLAGCVFRRPR